MLSFLTSLFLSNVGHIHILDLYRVRVSFIYHAQIILRKTSGTKKVGHYFVLLPQSHENSALFVEKALLSKMVPQGCCFRTLISLSIHSHKQS